MKKNLLSVLMCLCLFEPFAQLSTIYHVDFKVKGSQYRIFDLSGFDANVNTWVFQNGKMGISNRAVEFGKGNVALSQDDWLVCGPYDLTTIENGGFVKFITSRSWGSNMLSLHVSKTFNPEAPVFSPTIWRELSFDSDFPPNSINGVSDIHHYDIGTYNISSSDISLRRFRSSKNVYIAFRYLCSSSGTNNFDINDLKIIGKSLNNQPGILSQKKNILIEKGEKFNVSIDHLQLSNADEYESPSLEVVAGNNYTFIGNEIQPASNFVGELAINVMAKVGGVQTPEFKLVAQIIDNKESFYLKSVQNKIVKLLSVKSDIDLSEALTTQWVGDGSFADVSTSAERRKALYGRMAEMANVWYKQETIRVGSDVFTPDVIKQMLYKALLYYCENPASYNFPGGAFADPEFFGGIGVLLFDAIQEDKNNPAYSSLIENLTDALFELNKNVYLSGGRIDEDILVQIDGQGALKDHQRQGNLGYRLNGMLAACVATGKVENMEWLANHCRLQIPHVTNRAGYHPVGNSVDGSLFQHNGGGAQTYWLGYGGDWTSAVLGYQSATAGTPWAFQQDDLNSLADMFANGMIWGFYKGHFPFNIAGRGQTSQNANLSWSTYSIKQCTYLANVATNSSAKLLDEYVSSVREDQVYRTSITDSAKYFQNAEFMIHRTPKVQYCVKMLSNRSAGPESSTASNRKGFLLGDGSTFINKGKYDHQYSRVIWNWQAIPGITAEQRVFPAEYNNSYVAEWGKRGNSTNSYSGGLTNGKAGVCGFRYRRAYDSSYDYYPVIADKSYFFYEDNMIALGTGIERNASSMSNADIWTTIEQKDLGNKFVASIDGAKTTLRKDFITASTEFTKTSSNTIWFWHDNVGYIIYPKEGQSVEVAFGVKKESGNWRELSTSNANENVDAEVVYMAINHKSNPSMDTYNYLVLGDITEEEMESFVIADNGIKNLENSTALQAVSWNNGEYIQAVFYEAGSIKITENCELTVDKPAIIMMQKNTSNGFFVSVSDPLQVQGNAIEITINGEYSSNTLVANFVNGNTNVSAQMPSGKYIGSTLTFDLKASTATNVLNVEEEKQLSLFPNPLTENYINVVNKGKIGDYNLQITDIEGRLIKKLQLNFSAGNQSKSVYLPKLKSGSYVFNFLSTKGVESHKVIVN